MQQTLFADHTFASSRQQDMYVFICDKTLFVVPRKLYLLANNFFSSQPQKSMTGWYQTHEPILRYKTRDYLTQLDQKSDLKLIIHFVLTFFKTGCLTDQSCGNVKVEELLNTVKPFSLLEAHSRRGCNNQELQIDDFLLLALRQEFKAYIAQLVCYSDQVKNNPEQTRLIHSICETVIYFEPQNFELLWLKVKDDKTLEVFVPRLIWCYMNGNELHPEDKIHELENEHLRLLCIKALPDIDTKRSFLCESNLKVSNEEIFAELITPLYHLGMYQEAYNIEINWKNQEFTDYSNTLELLDWFGDPIGELFRSSNDEELMSNIFFISDIPSKILSNQITTDIAPFVHPQLVIRTLITKVFKCQELADLIIDEYGHVFIWLDKKLIETKPGFVWTNELLQLAIDMYIENDLENTTRNLSFKLKKKFGASSGLDVCMHPGFLEHHTMLVRIASIHCSEFMRILSPDNLKRMFKLDTFKIDSETIRTLVMNSAKRLFRKKTSLVSEFIVQYVCDYLQPYIQKKNRSKDIENWCPMVNDLKRAAKSACLPPFENKHIEFAFEVYMRKAPEVIIYDNEINSLRSYQSPFICNYKEDVLRSFADQLTNKCYTAIKSAVERDFDSAVSRELITDEIQKKLFIMYWDYKDHLF